MRADQLIVLQGLAKTRSAARRLIERGAVRWRSSGTWAVLQKAGADLPEDCAIEITNDDELRWATRGGLKLYSALDHAGISPMGLICLDVGQGAGGFTDVLLTAGARRVVGVDVGHGQLGGRLREDSRVRCIEGVNARSMDRETFGDAMPALGFPLIVGDLSFISISLVLPALETLLSPGGRMLLLVKPQFELQAAQIGKGGMVRNADLYPQVEARLRRAAADNGLRVVDWFISSVPGGGKGNQPGNIEFFLHAVRGSAEPLI